MRQEDVESRDCPRHEETKRVKKEFSMGKKEEKRCVLRWKRLGCSSLFVL